MISSVRKVVLAVLLPLFLVVPAALAQCPPTSYPIGSSPLSTSQVGQLSDADLQSELDRIEQLLDRCRQYSQELVQCYNGIPPSAVDPIKDCINKRRADLSLLKKEILARLSGAQGSADLDADRREVERLKIMKIALLSLQSELNEERDTLLSNDTLRIDPSAFEPPAGYRLRALGE